MACSRSSPFPVLRNHLGFQCANLGYAHCKLGSTFMLSVVCYFLVLCSGIVVRGSAVCECMGDTCNHRQPSLLDLLSTRRLVRVMGKSFVMSDGQFYNVDLVPTPSVDSCPYDLLAFGLPATVPPASGGGPGEFQVGASSISPPFWFGASSASVQLCSKSIVESGVMQIVLENNIWKKLIRKLQSMSNK